MVVEGGRSDYFSRIPAHVVDRIFSQLFDIRTRLRLESVSKKFNDNAKRFCWNQDRILEVTPHLTRMLELKTVNVKVLSDAQLVETRTSPDQLSIVCKVECLADAIRGLLSRVGHRLHDVRLWGSYSCLLLPKIPWVDRCVEVLADPASNPLEPLDILSEIVSLNCHQGEPPTALFASPAARPRITSLLMTSLFANSMAGADLVQLNARHLKTFHFLLPADHYDESRTAYALKNICAALVACTELQDLVLELSDNQIISDEVLADILANKQDLRSLRLRKVAGITGLGLLTALTSEELPQLQELELAQCRDLQLSGLLPPATLPVAFSKLKTFRYCPSEDDGNFGSSLDRIPDACPSIRMLDITELSSSLHNPHNLSSLIAAFLARHHLNKGPETTFKVEAHCVLILTLSQLTKAVLDKIPCDSVSKKSRQRDPFSCSEYVVTFHKGAAVVEFTFCVIQ